MNGAAELPSEANPLNFQTLLQTLEAATSSSLLQVRAATSQLQNWERQQGYYNLLQDAFIDKSSSVDVRYLAVIQLKNGIDKYWRRTASNVMSKEEKSVIRSRLYESGINEPDSRLALQNALVISKIIRFEFPADWPDAITDIVHLLRLAAQPGANPIHLPRVLLILLHIIKELSTARLQRLRTNLYSVTPETYQVLGRIYIEKVQIWRAWIQNGGGEGAGLEDIENSLLAIKALRRLMIAGYEFPNREKEVQEFWTIIRDQFGDFLNMVTSEPQQLTQPIQRMIEKHLLQLSKMHLEMARTHPAAFALLPDSINLVYAYWKFVSKFGENLGIKSAAALHSDIAVDEEEPKIQERLCLKGLLLIRACVKMVFTPSPSFKYRQEQDKEEQKLSVQMMRANFLTESFVRESMEVIVTRFFVFRSIDLQEWQEDPEEWERKEEGEGDSWEFSIKPCSERLFLDLVTHFKDFLIEPLINVFYSVSSPDNEDILFKDSVYNAIGLSAAVIHKSLDFDAFLTATLVAEVQKSQPGCNILRRRIAILLGQWVSVKISTSNRHLVYQIFQHLLDAADPYNDQVVRLTAGKQFKNVADEWEFEPNGFMPYATEILGRIMALIEEVSLTETKMTLLNTVSVIVERLEYRISPYADKIVSLLPSLWMQSGEEHLMKQAILTILTRLITSMKDDSRRYHEMILPLIKSAVEPESETRVYLLEDALDLWASIIVQTPSPASPDVLSLAPYLLSIFELGTETLRQALDITESYVLLAPGEMLTDEMRNNLIGGLASLLGTLKADANGIVTHLMEVAIRAANTLGGEQAVEVMGKSLLDTNFLAKVLEGLRESWEAHQTTGPNKKYSSIDGIVETDYFSVLARLSLASPRIFVGLMEAAGMSRGESFEQTLKWILDEWFSHFENVGDPDKRKLMCLALTRLLESGETWILSRLQDLIIMWTDVIIELQEGAEDKGGDLIYWDAEGLKPDTPEAPEDERRRNLTFTDPVHTINAIDFIRSHVQHAITACGGQEVFQQMWLANVDQDVIASFGKLGIV
ncbi:ARM repeat-containing protein [Xylona heveae TC161]|uniref:ARM repeat-containing protein n=1 Tax=Xylona heveae (strain CBS 132557 / TC161) TaxID=1328760 RepID=A0A165I6U8_XYLHT|nr:ARM repeat-containing protein [Xylona heveae TC161]KZF24473.1 ARM repeat-containing protein [Xylona heveae TC161]